MLIQLTTGHVFKRFLTLLFKCTYEKQREKQTFRTFEAMSMCLMVTLRMLEDVQSSSVRTKEKAKPPAYLPVS